MDNAVYGQIITTVLDRVVHRGKPQLLVGTDCATLIVAVAIATIRKALSAVGDFAITPAGVPARPDSTATATGPDSTTATAVTHWRRAIRRRRRRRRRRRIGVGEVTD